MAKKNRLNGGLREVRKEAVISALYRLESASDTGCVDVVRDFRNRRHEFVIRFDNASDALLMRDAFLDCLRKVHELSILTAPASSDESEG